MLQMPHCAAVGLVPRSLSGWRRGAQTYTGADTLEAAPCDWPAGVMTMVMLMIVMVMVKCQKHHLGDKRGVYVLPFALLLESLDETCGLP